MTITNTPIKATAPVHKKAAPVKKRLVTPIITWGATKPTFTDNNNTNNMVKSATASNRCPVQRLCLNSGTVLGTYDSPLDAADKTGIPHCTISKCLNRKARSAGGFFFRYAGASDQVPKPKIRKRNRSKLAQKKNKFNRKRVAQLCPKTGNVLETYDSIREAAEGAHVTGASIGNVCHGRSKTSGGYGWRLVDPDIHDPRTSSTPAVAGVIMAARAEEEEEDEDDEDEEDDEEVKDLQIEAQLSFGHHNMRKMPPTKGILRNKAPVVEPTPSTSTFTNAAVGGLDSLALAATARRHLQSAAPLPPPSAFRPVSSFSREFAVGGGPATTTTTTMNYHHRLPSYYPPIIDHHLPPMRFPMVMPPLPPPSSSARRRLLLELALEQIQQSQRHFVGY